MTESAVKPVIFAFSLGYVLDKEKLIQHALFVKPDQKCGEEVPNISQRKDLGVIAFSECENPRRMKSKELLLAGRTPLSAYRSNVDRVWKALFSFFREQERQAMRMHLWRENPTDFCPVSIGNIGYFHKFQAREGSEFVDCFPDINELYSDMPDLRSYATMFGNHRTP